MTDKENTANAIMHLKNDRINNLLKDSRASSTNGTIYPAIKTQQVQSGKAQGLLQFNQNGLNQTSTNLSSLRNQLKAPSFKLSNNSKQIQGRHVKSLSNSQNGSDNSKNVAPLRVNNNLTNQQNGSIITINNLNQKNKSVLGGKISNRGVDTETQSTKKSTS